VRYLALDPGHGGADVGAVGNGIVESVYNLAVCHRLEYELATRGIGCVLTRFDSDPTHHERAAVARDRQVAGVICVHTNADVPATHGPTAFHLGVNVRAIDAARAFVAKTGRGGEYVDGHRVRPMMGQTWVARSDNWTSRAWSCLWRFDEPVFLAELGYLSHVEEAAWLLSEAGQTTLVSALADAAQVLIG